MHEIKKIIQELEAYKDGSVSVYDAAKQIQSIAFKDAVSAFDLLQKRLEDGGYIVNHDGVWCLFDDGREYVSGGDTVREMIINLIFIDC